MRRIAVVVGSVLLSGLAAACTSRGPSTPTPAPGSTPSSTRPATTSGSTAGRFSPNVTNAWFPLTPGTTLVYRGTKDGKRAVDYVAVSSRTRSIDGVPCRIVVDRLFLDGALAESTRDYYTQDSNGNVWYYGEDTAELDSKGRTVSTEGTWHAGTAGARPGIFMPATPQVGETHRQEHLAGHAEDHFQVLDLSASISVPYRSFSGALLTREWTPLEPGVLDHKFYARGIGTIKETSVKGPREELALVAVKVAN